MFLYGCVQVGVEDFANYSCHASNSLGRAKGAIQLRGKFYPTVHCDQNLIYLFLYWKLHGLSPKFHIHVSVSDLYIARSGPHIFLQQNRRSNM
jgi:hypothetical protein